MGRLLGRNVEFIAQFTDIGDAHAGHAGQADIDFPHGAEGKGLVGQVGRSQRLQQFPRLRALDVELAVSGRHVGDEDVLVIADIPLQPGFHVPVRGVGCDHHELFGFELDHGQIGFEFAGVLSHWV